MSDTNNDAYLQHLYDKDDGEEKDDLQFILGAGSGVATIMSFALHKWDREDQQGFASRSDGGRQPGSKTKKRKGTNMDKYLGQMDSVLFRRRYQMT